MKTLIIIDLVFILITAGGVCFTPFTKITNSDLIYRIQEREIEIQKIVYKQRITLTCDEWDRYLKNEFLSEKDEQMLTHKYFEMMWSLDNTGVR